MEFFKELAANNSKDWFDVNRKRYKDSVKDPFDKFKCPGLLAGTLEYPTLFLEPFLPSMTYVPIQYCDFIF